MKQVISNDVTIFINQCLIQKISKRIPPAAKDNQYKNPQPDITQRKRLWNTQLKMGCFHQTHPARAFGTLWKRRQKIEKP